MGSERDSPATSHLSEEKDASWSTFPAGQQGNPITPYAVEIYDLHSGLKSVELGHVLPKLITRLECHGNTYVAGVPQLSGLHALFTAQVALILCVTFLQACQSWSSTTIS